MELIWNNNNWKEEKAEWWGRGRSPGCNAIKSKVSNLTGSPGAQRAPWNRGVEHYPVTHSHRLRLWLRTQALDGDTTLGKETLFCRGNSQKGSQPEAARCRHPPQVRTLSSVLKQHLGQVDWYPSKVDSVTKSISCLGRGLIQSQSKENKWLEIQHGPSG